jgi:hypothetical protein
MPRYPLQGQQVSFYALVKNQGNAMNSVTSPYTINYSINGIKVASSGNLTTTIAPGQVQLIASTGVWTCDQIGKSTLSGDLAFNQGASQEWDATNNTFTRGYEVFDPMLDPKVSNLAYQKPVTVSSFNGTNVASSLVDGDLTSRWESGKTDNEYATIDLQAIAELQKITIYWESAYAKTYKVESSLNGTDWTMLENITAGAGNTESYTINSIQGRYIRITCLERVAINNIKYGFSIYEVVVNGNVLQAFPDVEIAPVESQLYLPYAKTVLNGTLSGGAIVKTKLSYVWSLVSGPTDVVIVDPTSPMTLVKFKTAGTYVFNLAGTNATGSNSAQVSIKVLADGAGSDLALMKPTTTSGIESSGTNSDMAVDGDASTRWSSAFQDNQWWQVDLQHQIVPGTINIVWEAAYAKQFNLQISPDNVNWLPLYSNAAFTGGTSTITNSNSQPGRYVKVNCVTRATAYGSSFFSFNLSGSFINSTNHVPVSNAGNKLLTSGDATLNGNSSSDADNDPLTFKWEQLAGPSTATIISPTKSLTNVTGLKQGEYYFKLTVDDGKDVDFDIVKVVNDSNTKLAEVSEKEINIYPNPATDKIYISGEVSRLEFFTLQGQLNHISYNTNTVDVSTFSKGLYIVKITDKKGNKISTKLEIH